MTGKRKALVAAMAVAAASAIAAVPAAAAPTAPTIVLVHGAFADATSWDGVAAALRADGSEITASHASLVSQPAVVAGFIEQAAQ
ncbi:hypothetical protein [Nocardia sp. NPDC127526]|uniref:hypothetical protein n=1 Tax=Nocardia sp. NPDC127526 TaxID=3345393 RepID=UPI00363D0628